MYGRPKMMGSPNSVMDYVEELRNVTWTPVTKVSLPTCPIGPWLGTREKILLFFIPTVAEDLLEYKKSLFYLASRNHKFECSEILIIYINMIIAGFGNMSTEIHQTLMGSRFEVINYNKELTEEWINKWDKDFTLRKDYKDTEFTEEIAKTLMGIYWNFIVRKPNIRKWVEKSKPVYSKACLVDENNQSLETLDPNLRFAVVKDQMCGWFDMKNKIFLTIQTLSKTSNHELSVISSLTMGNFMMAEMEGFAMVVDILSRKPELCALKRIDKRFESFNLENAVNTFLKMGDHAPFCAFIHKPYISDNLKQFKAWRIQGYIDMANEIAITEGNPLFRYNPVYLVFSDEFLQKCKNVDNLIKVTSMNFNKLHEYQLIRQCMKNLKIP